MEAERINQIQNSIDDLRRRLIELRGIFDVDRKARRLEEVNIEIENPDLWNDPKHAQEVSKEKKLLDDIVGSFSRLTTGVNDAADLFDLSMAEEDWETVEAVGGDIEGIEKEVAGLEFKRMFNQPMDPANCYLEIQSAPAARKRRTGRA